MLDVAVSKIGLKSARVMPRVGQRETAGMSQHLGMGLWPSGVRLPRFFSWVN